jgi:DoxX
MNLGLLVLHVVVGLLFFAHGAQKLFGWFGGYGLGGTAGFFDQLGLRRDACTPGPPRSPRRSAGSCLCSACSRPSARPW